MLKYKTPPLITQRQRALIIFHIRITFIKFLIKITLLDEVKNT